MSVITDLRNSRELLLNLTRRELKGKYKRTTLGQLWSLANPLAAMAIYTVVFAFIMRVEPDRGDPSGLDIFALWLLCALLPWTFFTNVVNGGMSSLVGNENLIKKVHFPRIALVLSTSLSYLVSWGIEMIVLLVALLIAGGNPLPWLPVAAFFMVLLALFATGIAMMLAIANVYFRDTQHFVGIIFQAWFYLTPVVYPVSLVAGESAKIGPIFGSVEILDLYLLNPMTDFAEAFRNLLYDNRWPDLSTTAVCVAWSVGVFLLGYQVFKRHEKGLAEAL
ncbi:ABC transporter permease [Georgenia daeguensis]|uniref:Transport permease protein n=1 Tax=Georgenia daeguensis TaxID=908355 RepID=A0ABP6UQP7_9MICO